MANGQYNGKRKLYIGMRSTNKGITSSLEKGVRSAQAIFSAFKNTSNYKL